MPAIACFGALLENRVRQDPAHPLLVWYSPRDERVELSALTFANWVDKTVNLLGDLGWDDSPVVALGVAESRPAHWVSLVWVAAVWQLGGQVVLGPHREGAQVAVIGPENPHPVDGLDTIACSLHPLGLGFPDDRADEVIDYREVLGQPDVHTPVSAPADEAPAWSSPTVTSTHAEVVADIEAISARVLVTGTQDAYHTVRTALVAPLLGGGSSVLVEGTTESARLARIAAAERTTG